MSLPLCSGQLLRRRKARLEAPGEPLDSGLRPRAYRAEPGLLARCLQCRLSSLRVGHSQQGGLCVKPEIRRPSLTAVIYEILCGISLVLPAWRCGSGADRSAFSLSSSLVLGEEDVSRGTLETFRPNGRWVGFRRPCRSLSVGAIIGNKVEAVWKFVTCLVPVRL